ncbi:MAG: flavodoxin family protein [Pseudomonadota bacterium]
MKKAVIGFGGSPRKGGNSDVLLKTILAAAADRGALTRHVHLRDYQFQPCIGCEGCRKAKTCVGLNDGMQLLYPRLVESRGLVLVSPTHHYNITAWMKAFIDRLYCFYDFEDSIPRAWRSRLAGQGRKAAIAAVCEQEDAADMGFTLDAMRLPLEALGYEVVDTLTVLRIFHRGKVVDDPVAMAGAAALGITLADALAASG